VPSATRHVARLNCREWLGPVCCAAFNSPSERKRCLVSNAASGGNEPRGNAEQRRGHNVQKTNGKAY